MLTFSDITACIPTRGNKPMQHIIDTLPYDEIIIYDNSKEMVDLKVYARYVAASRAKHEVVYFQDDDVLFTEHQGLLDAWNNYNVTTRGLGTYPYMIANDAHGPNRAGYDDLALSAAGALVHVSCLNFPFSRYLQVWPVDEGFLYEADFIFGVFTSFIEVILPYERLYADEDYHLCRQPWQEDLKLKITNRARELTYGC